MPSPLEQQLLLRQPTTKIGQPIPLPTTDPNPPSLSKTGFEGGVDSILGMLGLGPETKANLTGQLLMAGLPIAGGVGRLASNVSDARYSELLSKFGGGGGGAAPNLPMDEASRMRRATEQGYTTPVYHGTHAAEDFHSFKSPISRDTGDFGIHVSPDFGTANNVAGGAPGEGGPDILPSARVMPLLAKMDKTLEVGMDMNQWHNPQEWLKRTSSPVLKDLQLSPGLRTNDSDALSEIHNLAKQHSGTSRNHSLPPNNVGFQQDLKDLLQSRGYDSIKYPNAYESWNKNTPSYMVLDPRQLRSTFAAFDPAKKNSKDLMAALLASTGIGTVAAHDGEK